MDGSGGSATPWRPLICSRFAYSFADYVTCRKALS